MVRTADVLHDFAGFRARGQTQEATDLHQCTLTVRENVLGGDSLLINDTREHLHEALVAPGQAQETARLQAAYEQEGGMSAAENETLEE